VKSAQMTRSVEVPRAHPMVSLLGSLDEYLIRVERAFPDTTLEVRGNEIMMRGPDAAQVVIVFEQLISVLDNDQELSTELVDQTISMLAKRQSPAAVLTSEVLRSASGRPVRPASSNQLKYVETISKSTITFGLGPAGTGKSYLAVAMAARALLHHEVKRIILTRPAVEAGEHLGFLPGDLLAKIDPYLRPLYDALFETLGAEVATKHLERGTIEVAPLAFMRGRTLNDAFVILDEAQNTTPEQMKMFLTRLGRNSKMVVTGDGSQVDLPTGKSGLVGLETLLGTVSGVSFVHLTRDDVVRHRIVAEIIDAYDAADAAKNKSH